MEGAGAQSKSQVQLGFCKQILSPLFALHLRDFGGIAYFCSPDSSKKLQIMSVLGEYRVWIKGDDRLLARCSGNSLLL